MHLPPIGIDHEIRDLTIQRIPLLEQRLERRATIAIQEQRAFAALLGARDLLVDARVEINHETATDELVAVFRIDHCPTARREYDPVYFGQVVERGRFSFAKSGLSLFLEYERNVDARARFDFIVTVLERQVERAREADAACASSVAGGYP